MPLAVLFWLLAAILRLERLSEVASPQDDGKCQARETAEKSCADCLLRPSVLAVDNEIRQPSWCHPHAVSESVQCLPVIV